MHALDWFGDLASWVLSLVPRLRHVHSTHAAVRFTRGKAYALKSGIHFYWPVWSSIKEVCKVRQTLNLTYQNIVTTDDIQAVVAVTVVYEITDALRALTSTDDIVDTIGDLSANAIIEIGGNCTSAELRRRVKDSGLQLSGILRKKIGSDLKSYGVRVRRAFICEFSTPKMIRIISNNTAFN